jgi:hypothetical protein
VLSGIAPSKLNFALWSGKFADPGLKNRPIEIVEFMPLVLVT